MPRKKKIIVVDDSDRVRSIIREALTKRGYEVIEAMNPEAAFRFFNGTQVDLLITDFDMPGMNGAELVSRMRSMSSYMYTPVIMLSNVSRETIADDIAGLNIAACIQKPFEVSQFFSIVERLAGKVRE